MFILSHVSLNQSQWVWASPQSPLRHCQPRSPAASHWPWPGTSAAGGSAPSHLRGFLADLINWKQSVRYGCDQWLSLPWPPLQIGPVMLPLRGLGPNAVKEIRRLLLRVGGLQHHAIEAFHTDGTLVTMSQGLWTKIFSNLYCMTSCNSYQIDHVAVLSKLKSCNLWASILLI